MIRHPLREAEATQIACRIVEAYGGEINLYRLIKLLYLVERRSWIELGQPAMGGAYYSLPDGPMISETAEAANPQNAARFAIWARHLQQISRERGSATVLLTPAGREDISDALLDIVDSVISMTKSWKNQALKDYCHTFKEFKTPPVQGRLRIEAEEILQAGGRSQETISKLQSESELWSTLRAVLA
jgi:hypothetical protein